MLVGWHNHDDHEPVGRGDTFPERLPPDGIPAPGWSGDSAFGPGNRGVGEMLSPLWQEILWITFAAAASCPRASSPL